MTAYADHRLNVSAGLLSVGVALVLVLLKLWAFAATGALSLAATLADSALDLAMSAGGLLAILYAQRPADAEHAFGHSSAEDLTALAQAALVAASGAAIGVAAVRRLLAPEAPAIAAEGLGMAVLVVSMALTLGLVLW